MKLLRAVGSGGRALVSAAVLLSSMGASCGGGAGAGGDTTSASRDGEGQTVYDPARAERLLATQSEAAARGEPGADERLARTRSDLLLLAEVTKDVRLLQQVAESHGESAVPACSNGPTAERRQGPECVPALFAATAAELRRAGADGDLALLMEAVAETWQGMDGAFFVALRDAWEAGGAAAIAAATLIWAIGSDVLAAAEQAEPSVQAMVLARGLGLECPQALPQLADIPPADRMKVLAEQRCLPACEQVHGALADAEPAQQSILVATRCDGESLGVDTELGRTVVASNLPAWITLRAVDWLADARNRLDEGQQHPLARTLRAQGLLDRMQGRLEEVGFSVPPAAGLVLDDSGDGKLELPRWPGRIPWGAPPIYALVQQDSLHLGVAPVVVADASGARIEGTAFPGAPVPAGQADGELQLEGEAEELRELYTRLRRQAASLRPARRPPPPAALLVLADVQLPARRLTSAAARLARELQLETHLAAIGRGAVGGLPVGIVPTRGAEAGRAGILLHLSAEEHWLSGPGGPIDRTGGRTTPSALREDLERARQLHPDIDTLQLSAGPDAPYGSLIDALAAASVGDEAPYTRVRLAPTGGAAP